MIQWYLHSLHICIVSIFFLENSSHPTEVFNVFIYLVIKQEKLKAVTPEPDCGDLHNAGSLGCSLAVSQLFYLSIP